VRDVGALGVAATQRTAVALSSLAHLARLGLLVCIALGYDVQSVDGSNVESEGGEGCVKIFMLDVGVLVCSLG
jgi:hypothetical protein